MDFPEPILALANAVRDAGGRAMLVGGCVRDELMGQQPKDWDLEVYGIEPARLRELLDQFGSVNVVGEALRFTSSALISTSHCRGANAKLDAVIARSSSQAIRE